MASDVAPDGGQREFELHLVWIFFIEQTAEPGGQEAAGAAMPAAATEWLAANGDADLESAYFDEWFAHHGVARNS